MNDGSPPLAGRIALVTGAGDGIGAAIAAMLVEAGARVVCCGRTPSKLEAVAETLGAAAIALPLDVTDRSAVAGLAARLPDAWSAVDILVNCAGRDRGGRQPFVDGDIEAWAETIDTNIVGLLRVTHALLPGMLERDRGHVVNIGSTAGLAGYAGGVAYAGSKHAVHGLGESLRRELSASDVRVSEILPGMVRTHFAYARWPDDPERARRFYDEADTLNAADVARAVRYVLCEPPGVEIVSLVIRPKGEG